MSSFLSSSFHPSIDPFISSFSLCISASFCLFVSSFVFLPPFTLLVPFVHSSHFGFSDGYIHRRRVKTLKRALNEPPLLANLPIKSPRQFFHNPFTDLPFPSVLLSGNLSNQYRAITRHNPVISIPPLHPDPHRTAVLRVPAKRGKAAGARNRYTIYLLSMATKLTLSGDN